jgi:short-subunit dehydrogenase
MKDLQKKFGSWAIITGASSGIGKEFATQLAANGINVILLARREQLLKELSDTLHSRYKVDVKYASINLSDTNFLKEVETLTKGLDIGLVISNAGGARMGAFHKIPITDFESMIHLNVMAQMRLSHWFTSKLSNENKRGGLLLVSSTTAYQGVPYAANYAAAKAYILNLGEALNFEYKKRGIHVSVLVPGPTDTPGLTENEDADMVKHLPMKPQKPADLVSEGLKALLKNKSSHIGGRMNRIMGFMMKLLMSRKGASKFWGKMMFKMIKIK